MRFKKALEIPVFVYTKQELEVQKLGLDDEEIGYTETQNRSFWCIDSAYKDYDNPERTIFSVGGNTFICPTEYKLFVEIINKHLLQN